MDVFGKIEQYIAIALLVLMGIVVIAGLAEVAYEIVTGLIQPPVFFLGVEQLIDTFGRVLMILIGLQLMATMHMYLSDHTINDRLSAPILSPHQK